VARGTLQLAGRTAVVTGAGSGIGRALAVKAAAEGMRVALCDVNAGGLAETARLAGCGAAVEIVDVSDEQAVRRFAARVHEQLPPVALLFANAGILRKAAVLELSARDWHTLYAVNVLGVLHTLQAFVPAMLAAGGAAQAVVTASTGAMSRYPGLAAYCGTKHALWSMCEGLDEDLAGTNVGVSMLMPGSVATGIFDTTDPTRPAPADSMMPEQVAEIAFAGAAEDRFMVLTHPAFAESAQARFEDALAQLRAPTP
jgi:NAD(P)-dependent dehydrogenase (short-subunit alcohol dehydrogenase family)